MWELTWLKNWTTSGDEIVKQVLYGRLRFEEQ